ncbi:hypothetical protein [Mesorhizobium delmotii]|uniref:hypothetical protein n=1 Tax=Mesorhizobium delmotii TaxID=1631247 RepID=UPI001057A561|nr:hypothetical protein [Mesorhizobium delmotii]
MLRGFADLPAEGFLCVVEPCVHGNCRHWGVQAAWGADGALCVSRTGMPDLLSMEGLAAVCPGVRQ